MEIRYRSLAMIRTGLSSYQVPVSSGYSGHIVIREQRFPLDDNLDRVMHFGASMSLAVKNAHRLTRSWKLNYSYCDLSAISGISMEYDSDGTRIDNCFIVLLVLIVAPGRCTRRDPFGSKVRNNDENDEDDGTVCHRFLRRRAPFWRAADFPAFPSVFSERVARNFGDPYV